MPDEEIREARRTAVGLLWAEHRGNDQDKFELIKGFAGDPWLVAMSLANLMNAMLYPMAAWNPHADTRPADVLRNLTATMAGEDGGLTTDELREKYGLDDD